MLPRASLRAIRPSTPSLRRTSTRHVLPSASHSVRGYAASRKPPPPPPAGRASNKPPPAQPYPGASGSSKQTSSGTSIPKDQGAKAQDGAKMGAAVGAGTAGQRPMPSAANAQNAAEDAAQKTDGELGGDRKPQEPAAQKADADEPVPGSIRDAAQEKQAAAENLTPPPEPPSGAPEEPMHTGPLPDLRQGLPSTFDFEFGGKGLKKDSTAASEAADGTDMTASASDQGSRERREREEREYQQSDYETSLDRSRARMANIMYAVLLSGFASTLIYTSRPFPSNAEIPTGLAPEDAEGWSPTSMYRRIRARFGNQVGYYTEPTFPKLLPEVPEAQRPPFTLVLSLEDLLIHSSWDRTNGYKVAKRPGIDYFIRYLSQYYELVLFTSVPLAIADPVIKKLDPYHFILWPLGREATKYEGGEYIKDLSYLNRDLKKTLIIDTHAAHVKNQPENAIVLPKWSGSPRDEHAKDLVSLIPFLEYVATMGIEDVRAVLKSFEGQDIATEFLRRESVAREEFQKQLAEQKKRSPRFGIGSLGSALGMKGSGGMGGGLVLADGQSVGEGLAQGKMMSDMIREQGQKQYEHLEKQIREHGEQWLKEEEEEEQRKLMEGQMKEMKKGALSWFGGGGGKE
ncbi:hypothetical protein D0863_12076 [Hortaea werneckii]|uniref:Mitochondrial import inner membrane translocase subunit TIM50 n=1 Tax=Hortaea werneckii TaxID=91943 RepID=A0A3M7D577_HORWE|nr:hypothetical protein D0863_12076 [Hortaea werneckii]